MHEDPDDIPTAEEGYDPDMSVEEALRKGIIAMVDTGTIAGEYRRSCGYGSPFPNADGGSYDPGTLMCSRVFGHAGRHAAVVRWDLTASETRKARKQRALDDSAQMAAIKEIAKASSEQQTALAADAKKAGETVEDMKRFERAVSRVYGVDQSKKAMFHDQNVGKVRGR